MPRFFTRTLVILTAIILSAAVQAGDLARPVPADAQVTRFTRFNIRYTLRDIIAQGVRNVEFYITDDMGASWRLYGEDPDRTSPMTVEVPGEGVYGFVCVVTDRDGNRERAPGPRTQPETVIVVDRTPPTAKWLAPTQDIISRGQPVDFSWESADRYFGDAPVTIQFAGDAQSNHDRNANWQTAAETLPANGTHTWTPPGPGAYNIRLLAEDRAGNVAVAYAAATIRVDNTPPEIVDVQPLRSALLKNDIAVSAQDDGTGVKEYSLYVSGNGSSSWTLVKETVDGVSVPVKRANGASIPWEAPNSGDFPLWPVVFDLAGNATPLPSIGVAGPYILTIDNEPPQVTLSSSFLLGRAAVLANESRSVDWTSYDPHISEGSAAIHLSLDNGNTWQELASLLPANGSRTINFPFGSVSEEARLKVTVADDFGNVGESISEPFTLSAAETTIDSITPRGGDTFQTPDYGGGATPAPLPAGGDWPGFGSGDPASPLPPLSGMPAGGIGMPAPQGTDMYGNIGGDMFGGGGFSSYSNESTAGSMPQAIMGGAGQPATPAPVADPAPAAPLGGSFALPVPPADSVITPALPADTGVTASDFGFGAAPTTPDTTLWQPTPGAAADAGGSFASGWQASSPALPATDAGGLFGATPPVAAPVPPPQSDWAATPAQPDAATAFTESGLFGGPPPVQQPGEQLFPAFDSSGGGDLSLDSLGSGGFPASLGSSPVPQPPAAQPSASSGFLRPPSMTQTPPALPVDTASTAAAPTAPLGVPAGALSGSGSQVWPAVTDALPPQTPAGPPPSMPSIASGDTGELSLPQPLADTPASAPVNQRSASNYHVTESKAFRDENRVDLAIDSAKKALEADPGNPAALMELSQVNARMEPPDYVTAANYAKEATTLEAGWETWWNCADIFYIWANATNREIQAMQRSGQTPPVNLVDERNSTLSNAFIAVNNAASLIPQGDAAASRRVAVTQGMIAYQRALSVPEPSMPATAEGPEYDDYRRRQGEYKTAAAPLLQEAMPYFQNAMRMGGPAEYTETFQLGLINFRLANLERDTGNTAQAASYYQDAITLLDQATSAANAPKDGPREAYYMLALCYDQLGMQPGGDTGRQRELALRYWRQTADFYEADSPYRLYAEQRIDALGAEMGL